MTAQLPFSRSVRLNQVGVGVTQSFDLDEVERRAVAKWLDLPSVDRLHAEVRLAPAQVGWLLTGRVTAEVVQSCGLTLQPLPAAIDQRFSVRLVEQDEVDGGEIEVTLDDDGADVIENGQIDLGQHVVEQLSLALDPFPRAPGAEFVQPEETAEISPFAVLKSLANRDGSSET